MVLMTYFIDSEIPGEYSVQVPHELVPTPQGMGADQNPVTWKRLSGNFTFWTGWEPIGGISSGLPKRGWLTKLGFQG